MSSLIHLFQSYYSLISNLRTTTTVVTLIYFNPIIVLFLTKDSKLSEETLLFQSYYSLISNIYILWFCGRVVYFNPIIVLFLTL